MRAFEIAHRGFGGLDTGRIHASLSHPAVLRVSGEIGAMELAREIRQRRVAIAIVTDLDGEVVGVVDPEALLSTVRQVAQESPTAPVPDELEGAVRMLIEPAPTIDVEEILGRLSRGHVDLFWCSQGHATTSCPCPYEGHENADCG